MRNLKMFGVLVAVFALSAIGAAGASAAAFTASETGEITGKALENQVFKINGGAGVTTCTSAATSGKIVSKEATSQHVTVHYTGCTAFGFATVHINDATYEFTAHQGAGVKNVHLLNTVTITPTFFGASVCTITLEPQSIGTVTYDNSAGKIKVTPNVTGIKYTSSGGGGASACGEAGTRTDGTYTGANETERKGGGTISVD